jgi:predicted ester cyclase
MRGGVVDTELNKRNVRRVFEEGFNEGRLSVIDECLAPDAVDRHEFTADAPDFRSHLKSIISMLRASFPDLHMTVEDLLGDDDRVAARVTVTGTHTGAPLLGVPAIGAPIQVEQFHFVRCDDLGRGITHAAYAAEDQIMRQVQTPTTATATARP